MGDGLMAHAAVDVVVGRILIGRDQRNLFIDRVVHEASERPGVRFADNLANHVAFALDSANHAHLAVTDGFAHRLRPGSVTLLTALLVPMAIAILPADVGFIDFNDPHQFMEVGIVKVGSEPHANVPSGLVRTRSDHAMNLDGADAFFRDEHEIQNLEPRPKWVVCILEYRADVEREAIGRFPASVADPMIGPGLENVEFIAIAARAADAFRPALRYQVILAGRFIRKHGVKLLKRHLAGEFRFVAFRSRLVHTLESSAERGKSQVLDTRPAS